MTKAVLFDLGDTLFRLLPMRDITGEFAELLSAEGFEDGPTEAVRIVETFRERLMAGYARGDLLEPPVSELVVPFIGGGRQAHALAAQFERLVGESDVERWEPPAGREAVLDALRGRGLRIGYVSNTLTAPRLMRGRLEEVGLLAHAEVAVFSVEQGVRKPNPEIYRHALRSLGIEPADAIFVGDRVREDVRGPRSVGMRAVLTHEFRQEETGDSDPLAVISHLAELTDLF